MGRMNARMKIRVAIAMTVLALLLIGGGVFAASDKIKFDHKAHLEEIDDCATCHKAALEDKGLYKVLPEMSVCAECHDVKDKESCDLCHTNEKSQSGWAKKQRATNFLHSGHKDEIADCTVCHGDKAKLDDKPHKAGNHESCGICHQAEDIDGLKCAKCHRDFWFAGQNKMSKYSHKDNFLKEHGEYATRSAKTCTQCHRESYCSDCHSKKSGLKPSIKYPESVGRNLIHRGDWMTLHRIEAKTDESSCLKCHARKDCSSCHTRSGVSGRSEDPLKRHPSGWVKDHGDEARKNILSCASCHEGQGPGYCVDCHKASSGNNPHPKGWEDKARGVHTDDRVCSKCHGK
jgi:hypothetical protein